MFDEYLPQAPVKVCLEIAVVFELMTGPKRPDSAAGFPLFFIHFVAADVKLFVGKQAGHLPNE